MPLNQQHIIRRQILDVELPVAAPEARRWQEQLNHFAKDVLPARMEAIFDSMTPNGELMRLDSLDIAFDIQFDEGNWEERLVEAIAKGMKEAMPTRTQVAYANGWDSHGAMDALGGPSTDAKPLPSSQAGPEGTTYSLLEQFFYFLETGRLPWNANEQVRRGFENTLMQALAQQSYSPNLKFVFQTLMKQSMARQRLVWQFSENSLSMLADCLVEVNKAQQDENGKLVKLLKKELPKLEEALYEVFWELIFENNCVSKTFDEAYVQRLAEKNEMLRNDIGAVLSSIGLFKLAEIAVAPSPPGLVAKNVLVETDKIFRAEEGIYLDNAGLVLLHPFLPTFFESTGCVNQGKLTDPHRAVHLLQFLATGQIAPPEHLLSLNKLLCGLPLDMPIKHKLKLSNQEKAEAEHFLQSVIELWKALGKSSVQNLQGSFLCREGMLTHSHEFGWKLKVAPFAWDILMNELPWGIGMVKLPWMEELLWVEWTY